MITMLFFISIMLIAGLGLPGWLYLIAAVLWLLNLE